MTISCQLFVTESRLTACRVVAEHFASTREGPEMKWFSDAARNGRATLPPANS
jgi:hypothetical protein